MITLNDLKKHKDFSSFQFKFFSNFPSNYSAPEMVDQCWEWQGKKHGIKSRGRIRLDKENCYLPHRISYLFFNGPLLDGKVVRHTCDNPCCLNPKHLVLGTHAENSRDMVIRNRQGDQKLNTEAVKVIKWMLKYKPKRGLAAKLARLYHVSPRIISDIKHHYAWAFIKV